MFKSISEKILVNLETVKVYDSSKAFSDTVVLMIKRIIWRRTSSL